MLKKLFINLINMNFIKNQPYNLFIEKIILCSILLSTTNLQKVFKQVKSDFFYFNSHQTIFNALCNVYNTDGYINYIQVNNILYQFNENYVIEFSEIINLSKNLFISIYIDDYILLLIDKYIRRSLINLSFNLIISAQDNSIDLKSLLEIASNKISHININSKKNNNISSLVSIYNEVSTDFTEDKKNMMGVPSGFRELDLLTQGFQNSDLIIIAGRPSMGKTAFALNIASNVATSFDKKVIIFSLEMSKKQLFFRLISSKSRITSIRLKNGQLSNYHISKIQNLIEQMSNIYIDDSPNLSSYDIIDRIETNAGKNIGMIVIDYLQLMYADNQAVNNSYNRVQELSNITRSLKSIARKLQVPIILISQVNRSVEYRTDKRPLLSDLKDSGCLSFRLFIDNRITYRSIKKIFFINKRKKIWAYSFSGSQFYFDQVYNAFSTGYKSIYTFNYFGNSFIEITSNHKIFSNKNWLRLDSMTELYNYNFLNKMNVEMISLNSQLYYNPYIHSFINCNRSQLNYSLNFIDFIEAGDITMSKFHNFISGKCLLHNSIEQDADLVCMLYRDAYYDKSTDLLDETEVIITKQRNGPLGTVRLSFDPTYMVFSDI
uniref:replication helicase subunit n=1 Tax=Porphyridium aerugineum TaxID=2792 RepID=UPI001FCCD1EE|nr:replication helicase subunit [Porphyridium aerugineum]UNJ17807.1 replication helicase subunit [Porphyridium aerugineum]